VWNGVTINSPLNGQADFNLIQTTNYDQINVRSGGGSVAYGSGAIGGSIHLTNNLRFEPHSKHRVILEYGSYNTANAGYRMSWGSNKWALNLGFAHQASDNDFEILGTNKRNENAAFNTQDLSINAGYFLNQNNILKLYHQSFFSDRELAATLLVPSNDAYQTNDHRSILEWLYVSNRFTSSLKLGRLQEEFRFFDNKDIDQYSFGKATKWLVRHRYDRSYFKNVNFSLVTDYSWINGNGDSFNNEHRRAFCHYYSA
jgi:vitamin B12 transporter